MRVRSTIEDGSGQRTATMTFKGPVLAGSFKSREELEVRVSDAEAVQQQIVDVVRRLEDAGEIDVSTSAEAEQYIA